MIVSHCPHLNKSTREILMFEKIEKQNFKNLKVLNWISSKLRIKHILYWMLVAGLRYLAYVLIMKKNMQLKV